MELKDPFPAYTAESNVEAILLQQFLESRGIEAYAVEDQAATWGLSSLSEVSKPQVWISREDEQRVAALLTEYEHHKAERDAQRKADESKTIEAVCESCGQTSTFPGSLNGTTQNCSHCGGFVDVGTYDWPYEDDFGEAEASS